MVGLRLVIHLILHFLLPLAVARVWFKHAWFRAGLWMLAGLAIDLDHLLAQPVYDPNRCSLGFHPLHTLPAILAYFGFLGFKRARWLGLGLLLHIGLDLVDCGWMRWRG